MPEAQREVANADQKRPEPMKARTGLGAESWLAPKHEKADQRGTLPWSRQGDLPTGVADWIGQSAEKLVEIPKHAFVDRMKEIADAAAGEDPSPLERLLADRIGLCWGFLAYTEALYFRKLAEGMALPMADYMDRHQDRAQRRYVQAVKALAQVRKLMGPNVQVNIERNQVNVAGG